MGADGGVDAEAEVRILAGGPVQSDQGYVLYSADYPHDGTVIFDDLTAQADRLADIALKHGTYEGLIAFGYAGWGADQLESEIESGAWFAIPADEALLFDDQIATKWQRALARRGLDL
jgi:putative transcriptional regulator